MDRAARHLAVIATDSGERELALDSRAPEIALSGAGASVLQIIGRFVTAGVEHKPYAEHEVKLLLIEPRGVLNTGHEGGKRTAENDVWI